MCWLCVFILLTSSCVVMHNFLPIMKMLGQLKMNIYFTLWGCCWIYFWLRSLPESNEASLPGSVAMVMTCWWVCCTSQWRFFHGRASVQNQLQHELLPVSDTVCPGWSLGTRLAGYSPSMAWSANLTTFSFSFTWLLLLLLLWVVVLPTLCGDWEKDHCQWHTTL